MTQILCVTFWCNITSVLRTEFCHKSFVKEEIILYWKHLSIDHMETTNQTLLSDGHIEPPMLHLGPLTLGSRQGCNVLDKMYVCFYVYWGSATHQRTCQHFQTMGHWAWGLVALYHSLCHRLGAQVSGHSEQRIPGYNINEASKRWCNNRYKW